MSRSKPTPAEKRAQQWHDMQRPEDEEHAWSICWCCCTECSAFNPHFDAAKQSMRENMQKSLELPATRRWRP